MTDTRQHIFSVIESHREAIRSLGVTKLALFGSAARAEDTGASDLDFVVEFERTSFDAYMALKELLEGLFERNVDLVLPDAIKPRLRSRIMKELVNAPGL